MPEELTQAFLVWLRVVPLGLGLASFTRGFVPAAVALSLTLALACALLSSAGPAPALSGAVALALASLRELAIGATFALALALALLAAPWAVHMSDASEGLGELRRTLAVPYALCAAWLVLALGAARAIVIGLAESFRDAPLAAGPVSSRDFALGVAQLASDALLTALGFALPLLVTVWLLAVASATMRRLFAPSALAPQPALAALVFTVAAALWLVPTASRAPEAVRQAIAAARALTRTFAR